MSRLIYTGTLTVIERILTGYDDEGNPVYSSSETGPIDANFQNKMYGELKFEVYGLNDRDDNKYIFCEENAAIKPNSRIRNNSTYKVYEAVKIFDGYPDGHVEIVAKPVVGE